MGMLLYILWYIDYSQLSSHLPPSGQTKSTVKRKLYEDGALPVASEGSKKVIKKATATVSMVVQSSSCSQPSLKKQKTGGESGE